MGFRERLVGEDATFADDHEMGGILFEFAEDVGGDEDGHAFVAEAKKELGEFLAGFGVEA